MAKLLKFADGSVHYVYNENLNSTEVDGQGPIEILEATPENMELYLAPEIIERIREMSNMIQSNKR